MYTFLLLLVYIHQHVLLFQVHSLGMFMQILNFRSVLVDVRAMVPELEFVVSSLRQSVYDVHMTAGETYFTGIALVGLTK